MAKCYGLGVSQWAKDKYLLKNNIPKRSKVRLGTFYNLLVISVLTLRPDYY